MALQSCVQSPRIWVICEVVVKVLSLIIIGFVLNQSQGYWLFPNALQFVISTYRDIKKELAFQIVPNSSMVKKIFLTMN
jgi:hypothetical protein